MNNEERNYNLLRPATIEYVKGGGKVCLWNSDKEIEYFVTKEDRFIAMLDSDSSGLWFADGIPNVFRQVPLCWVESKPVYKGDVLYTPKGEEFIAGDITDFDIVIETDKGNNCKCATVSVLSWTKPVKKKKYWVNLYEDNGDFWCVGHYSEDAAVGARTDNRGVIAPTFIKCVEIELEDTND